MTSGGDPAGDAQRQRFADLLDSAAETSQKLRFWWRDDDAQIVTPALERLLTLAGRHQVPLGLAVIPKGATHDLAERLTTEPQVTVLQHGWQHKSHSPDGERKMELGDHRPLTDVLGELEQGFRRLSELFPAAFRPVLVPPWNRIGDRVRDARTEVGLIGFSGLGPAPAGAPHWTNVHVDIIDWKAEGPRPRAAIYERLIREVEGRLDGADEPIGIMTHHLVHREASWATMEELLSLIGGHAAVQWPQVDDLFGLSR